MQVTEGFRFSGRWLLGTWPAAAEPFLEDLFARNPHATMREVFDALWDRGYRPRAWHEGKNVTCIPGKNILAQLLVAGSTTSAGGIVGVQYVAVGTGAGTPASSDTQLFSELSRLVPAATSTNTGVGAGEVDAYWGPSQAIGQITEVGCFGGGTATSAANTGAMFNHYALTQTKTVDDTLTAACQFTF